MASIDRTAYPFYRRTLSLVELERHYTLTAEEREWLGAHTRRPPGLLCCAVLLKAVQHLGSFPVLSLVPESVIAHLRLALALPETTSIFGVSGRSVKTYIQRIRTHQGLISHGRTVRHHALVAMLQASETSDAPVDLINVTLERLHQQRVEFPAFSTLDRMARRVRTLAQARQAALLRSRLTEPEVAQLLALLESVPNRSFTPGTTSNARPSQPPTSTSPSCSTTSPGSNSSAGSLPSSTASPRGRCSSLRLRRGCWTRRKCGPSPSPGSSCSPSA